MMQSTRQVHMWFEMQEHEGRFGCIKHWLWECIHPASAASVMAWEGKASEKKRVAQAMSKMTTARTIGIYFIISAVMRSPHY